MLNNNNSMEDKDIKVESTNPASEIPMETVQLKSRRGAGKSYTAAMEYFEFKDNWKGPSPTKEETPAFERTEIIDSDSNESESIGSLLGKIITGKASTTVTTSDMNQFGESSASTTIKLQGGSGLFGTYQDYLDANAKLKTRVYEQIKSAPIPKSPPPIPTPYVEETSRPSDSFSSDELKARAEEAHRRITEEGRTTATEFSELNHPRELRIQSPYTDFINDYRRRIVIALTSSGVTAKNIALNDALEFTRYADHEFTNLLKNKVKEEPFKNLPLNEVEEVIVNVEELSRTLAGIMLGVNPENEESLCEAQEEKAAELAKLIFSHKRKTDA